MGRGGRQDGALSFSNPLRRQKLREPKQWGESHYRFRYLDRDGEAHEEHGAARDALVEPFLWVASRKTGAYQIIHSTALRDAGGDLVWHNRLVDNLPTDECSYKSAEKVVEFLNDYPQGHALKERIDGEEITLQHVYTRENSYSAGGGISLRQPTVSSDLSGITLNKNDGEEAIGKAYAEMKAKVDKANLDETEDLQERYLNQLAREKGATGSQEILDKVKADYEKAVRGVEQKQEAFDDYLEEKEESEDKLDDKTRAKRAQSTIDALRRS